MEEGAEDAEKEGGEDDGGKEDAGGREMEEEGVEEAEKEGGDEEEGNVVEDQEGEDNEEETPRKRKRRADTKRYEGETKRPRRTCDIEGCKAAVVNMARPRQTCHAGLSPIKNARKGRQAKEGNMTYKGRLQCGICGSTTIRMDVHLKTVHKLVKGTEEYTKSLADAVPYEPLNEADDWLNQALTDYGKTLTDRASGVARKNATAQSHIAAVKFWLPDGLTQQTITDLNKLGSKDGQVDKHVKEDRVKPTTLKVYLHSLAGFLQCLSGSRAWLRHLAMTADDLKCLEAKVRNIAKSLKEDVLRDKVERHARGEDMLDVDPAQVAAYLEGGRPLMASNVLQEVASGAGISRVQILHVRNAQCMELLLSNAKRAGDITHIRKAFVMKAQCLQGEDAEVEVYENKEARFGKVCPIRINPTLLHNLKLYGEYITKPSKDEPYLF